MSRFASFVIVASVVAAGVVASVSSAAPPRDAVTPDPKPSASAHPAPAPTPTQSAPPAPAPTPTPTAAPAPPAPAPSTAPAAPSNPPAPCVFTNFRTQLVAQACARGGQNEAKEVMKTFTKDKKIKSCNQCHSKLAPKYELKADGLEQFFKSGGK